jgi:hypothetical protein
MSEMVERVAKAIGKTKRMRTGTSDSDVNVIWFQLARAAIGAMREPTDEILRALLTSSPSLWPTTTAFEQAREAWRRAIDAARSR